MIFGCRFGILFVFVDFDGEFVCVLILLGGKFEGVFKVFLRMYVILIVGVFFVLVVFGVVWMFVIVLKMVVIVLFEVKVCVRVYVVEFCFF